MSRAESNGSKKSIFFSIFAPFNELLFRSIMQSTRARARCRAARDNHVSVGAALIWRGAIDRFHSRSDCLSNHIFLHRRPSIEFHNLSISQCESEVLLLPSSSVPFFTFANAKHEARVVLNFFCFGNSARWDDRVKMLNRWWDHPRRLLMRRYKFNKANEARELYRWISINFPFFSLRRRELFFELRKRKKEKNFSIVDTTSSAAWFSH